MMKAFNVPTRNSFAQLDSDAESDQLKTTKSTPEHVVAPPGTTTNAPRHERPSSRVQDSRLQDSRVKDSRQQEPRFPRNDRVDQDRPVRGGFRGGRGGSMPVEPHTDEEVVDADGHVTSRPARHGNRRFDRGGRNYSSFRGREFERHSGTGRGREIKKSGAGNHNWGRTEGFAQGVVKTTIADEEETERIAVGSSSETPAEGALAEASTSETEKEKDEPVEDLQEDYSEWQKKQKQKRALLLQEKMALGSGPARAVDATDLEKDGYHLYERHETAEERAVRETRMNTGGVKPIESEDDEAQRPRTYNIFEFTGDYGRRGSRGGRGGGGRGMRGRGERERRINAPEHHPIVLDLHDASAFPSLLNG